MAGTVTSQLTNVTEAETGDGANWDDIGGGPGSGQGDDIPIQGSQDRSRRADNVTVRGFSYDNTTGLDLSAYNTHVGFWVNVLQPGLITTYSLLLGGGTTPQTSPWSEWDIYNNTTLPYPAVGGWQRVWIDPTRTRDDGAGTLDLSSVNQFGCRYDMGNVGGTSPNMHLDRIDYLSGGGGLLIDTGFSTSPGVFDDFVTEDNQTSTRYGVVLENNGIIFCLARLQIADGTSTIFDDSGFVVVFAAQQFVNKEFMGITIDLQNGGTTVDFANAIIRSGGTTNLGDLRVINASGAFTSNSVTYDNLRRALLNNAATFTNGSRFVNSGQIDPTNSKYTGYVDLPGTDEYVDTQETIDLNNLSGDVDIVMCVAADDWTPAATETLMSHYGGTIATESFRLQLLTTGIIRFIASNGTAETTFDATTAVPALDGRFVWIRVEYTNSSPQATFSYSFDPLDTPPIDISWSSLGTATGTYRLFPSISRVVLIGAENDSTPTNFFAGNIHYADIILQNFREVTDGFIDGPEVQLIADWRTGTSFTGSPSTRVDDWDGANYTWELNGTAPTYSAGDNYSSSADLRTSTISNSVSASALRWNVNTDPNDLLDDITFVSSGTGHGLELGPNCPTSITLDGVIFTGYAGSNGLTGNEAIFNNSNKSITITVVGGGTTSPSIRNMFGSSTTLVANTQLTLTGMREFSEVRIYNAGTTTEIDGIENAIGGSFDDRSFAFTATAAIDIDIVVFNTNFEPVYLTITVPATDSEIPISQRTDRNYDNP